jgi:DNA-binding transcriptional MerR regulator
LTHLSVRTLLRCHESGLPEPATVDPGSGYRYYTSEQIPAGQVIHRLREPGMPLPESAKSWPPPIRTHVPR